MKLLYFQWKRYTLSLLLILFAFVCLHAQVKEGVVRVKLSEEKATFLQSAKLAKSSAGYVTTGDKVLDNALTASKAYSMKRVFRPAGKFEAKHRKYGLHLWYEITFDKSTKVQNAISNFAGLKEVQVSEPIYEKAIIGYNDLKVKRVPLNTEADDPQYGGQWHYNNTGQTGGTAGADIDAPQAWSIETGSSDVIIAVTDGGIDVDHEDLAANMWVNTGEIPGNGVDDDGNGYVDDVNGYGFGDDSGTIPGDTHGTHVGGTVGAVTNNGIGVAGVAGGDGSGDGIRLMSCAAFGQFGTGGFAETYIYAADMGAVISQNSWGYTNPGVFEQAVLDAVDYFIAEAGFDEMGNPVGPMQGGIVIFAAGNDGSDDDWYPGIYEPIVAVGGTDHNDDQYVFSNRGDWVDLAAPAVNVLSTLPNNSYGTLTGTSMACPHVSGVAGLIVSQSAGNITPAQVRARLEQTTDPLPGLEFLGTGRLNAFAALQQDDGVAPDAITDLAVSDKDLSSVMLAWTAPADAGNGSATTYDIRYSTSAITAGNFASATPVVNPPGASLAGTAEMYIVSGLSSSTTYYFAIKSSDFFGNESMISNVVSETTDDPPSASVNPSSMTSDLSTGETETQTLTITNSGAGPLSFDLSFGGTSFTPASLSISEKIIKPHSKIMSSTKAYVASGVQTLAGDQYATGFEGLSTGDIDGQDGWSGSFEDWTISTDNPYAGSQHLKSVSETLPSGSAQSLAFSPNVGVGSETYSSTTAKLNVDNNGVTWQFIPQSPTEELIVTRVSFDADGSISIYDGGVDDFVSVPASVPSGYFDLKLVVHRTDFDMNLYINNELVYVGEAVTGDIEQVVLLSLMEQEGNEFSMDDLSIFDGEIDTYPFLSADVTSGEVAGGSSQDIAITFDATGLFGGTYENEIQIRTNDPANPDFTIPATMNVTGTGKPIISVDPASLVFDDTFVGGTSSLELEITNGGTEILNVTDISATADFGVNGETSFTLLPFESTSVNVEFSPSSLGALSGTLTITNNDTDNPLLEVPLSGNGVDAPAIAVSPSSFTEELERGSSVDRILTITNNGVADLEFEIETNEVDASASSIEINIPSNENKNISSSNDVKQKISGIFSGRTFTSDVRLSSGPLNVLVLSPDDDVSDVQNTLASFPDLNVTTYPKPDLPGITLADLTAFDVVMTTNNTQWLASGSVDPALIGDLLADYIDQGGKVIANCFAYDYDAWALEGRFITDGYGPFTGTSTDFFGSTSLGTIHAPDHPVMEGVSAIGNSYLWQDPELATGATLLADWNDGSHFAAANENVVALNILPSDGSGAPGWTGDLAVMYHNAILWLTGSGFVSADVESGVLAEGESIDVGITISAEGLESGNYQATIDITSNDPSNGLVQVPVDLTVLGPAVTANPESMEVTVLQGLSEGRTLTLSNNGSADANFVLDIVNSGPDAEPSAVIDNSPPRSTAYSGTRVNYASPVHKSGVNLSAEGDEVYSTGFESFSIGNINGQQGWTGQFGNWRVENFDPKNGNKHFQGLSDGLGQSVAYTPALNMTEEAITSASMDVYLETGASWWISTESSSAINGRVIFDQTGNVVMVSDDGAGGAQLDTLDFNIPDEYFNVAFEVDKTSEKFRFYINEVQVFEGDAFSTDLEFVVVLSQMEVAGPVFNMDNVNVYEGRYVPEFLQLSAMEGVISAGSSVDIEVEFDGDNVPFGTYFRDLQVFVNEASVPDIVIPTTFNVTGPSAVEVTPQLLEQVVNYKENETTQFMINNTGGQPIDYSISVIGADLSEMSNQSSALAAAKKVGAKYDQYLEARKNQEVTGGVKKLMVGETLMEENFDGGTFPPAGWSVVDNEGSGLQWDFLVVHDLDNWSGSGEAAAVNSDANQGVEFDTELITPVIDIAGRTGVVVQYNVNYINFIGSDFLDLDVTTDGGATWTNVLRWNESHGSFFSTPGESVAVELDDYVSGASNMQLRWRYYDPNSGDWDYYVQIDDVEIMADANAWLTVNPAGGTVPVGQNIPVDVNFDASKVDPDEYFAGILVNSNAVNAPVASVFAIMEVLEPAEIEVSPASMEQTLVTGFSDTQTLSITNNGESILRYNLGGFAKDARVVSVTKDQNDPITTTKRTERYTGDLFTGKAAIKIDGAKRTAAMPVYGTDFESFTLGDINNQNEWFGQFGNWTVEEENPDSGNQHFRGLSDGLGQSLAISPGVGIGSEPISSFSTDVAVDGTGVTWQLIPQSPTAESVVTRIQINPNGSMDALVDDGSGGTMFEPVAASLPSGYFNLKIQSERATGIFDVFINRELVYTGQGFAGDIEEIAILSLMEAAGPTMDLDDMNIWDGEAPIPFLSTNPEFGNVASGETVEIEVTFDATQLEKGIYEDQIIVFNNDPENPEVVVPVTLEVVNPPALEVDPESIESYVFVGTTKDHTMTVTNTGEATLRFGFAGFGDAPTPGVFSKPEATVLSERQLKKKADDDLNSKPQDIFKPVRFMEGEQLLYEGFENAFPPEGWTTVDNEGNGLVWGATTDNYSSGMGNAAMANSDAFGTAEYDTELISPEMDVDGKAGVVVQYYASYQNLANLDFLDLDISTDGGSTWTTVLSWNEDHGGFFALPGEFVSIELDDYIAGASTMMLRWHYYNPNSGDWDWYAQIDEVEVLYEGVQWLTVNPGQGAIEQGQSIETIVTFDATSVEPDTYNKELLLLTNVPDEPEKALDMTMYAVIVEDLEMAAVCSDNPDETRRWEVNNPNPFELDAFWFVVGSSESDSVTLTPGVNYFTSTTQTDRPNTVKLRWLDHTGAMQDVTVESTPQPCFVEDLNLTSMCSNNPDLFRRWRVRNPNPFEVMVDWSVYGTSQSGTLYAAGDSDTFFYTEAIDGANTTAIKWLDENGDEQQKVKASSGEICDVDNSCSGGNIIAFNQGTKKNGRTISARRSNSQLALGIPEENDEYNFVSLGFGGSIDIELGNIVVDQPGNDFMVLETSFNDLNRSCAAYEETADVFVSQDGVEYYFVGSTCRDGAFDISVAGLMDIQYVRIVDTSDPSNFGGNADGYDVDGIHCINAHYSAAQQMSFGMVANTVPDEEADEMFTSPNPFKERIDVKVKVEREGKYVIKVHDIFGMLVLEKEVNSAHGQIDAIINTLNLPSGTYLLTVISEDESYRNTHTLIKN